MSQSLKSKKAALDALNNLAKKKESKEKVKSNKTIHMVDDNEPSSPPQSTPEMFYGLAGKVGLTAAYGAEVNPVSCMLVFLSFVSANIGRDTFLDISDDRHHMRLFTLHVGRSSVGGKGMSTKLTHRIRARIEEKEPHLLGQTHVGGLSSGEGLVHMIRDKSENDANGVLDKRLWVVESEFGNALTQMTRSGNTLSTTIRDLWDGIVVSPATKGFKMTVTDPHVAMHGCITPIELKSKLTKVDANNGFSNRLLIAFAENVNLVPRPKRTPDYIVDNLADLTIDVIKFALGGYPDTADTKEITE